jgi:hypothetical protein
MSNTEFVLMLTQRHAELQKQAATLKEGDTPEEQLEWVREHALLLGRMQEVNEMLSWYGCCVYTPGGRMN